MISEIFLTHDPEERSQSHHSTLSAAMDCLNKALDLYREEARDGWYEDIDLLAVYKLTIEHDYDGITTAIEKVVECKEVNVINRPPDDCPGWEDDEKTYHVDGHDWESFDSFCDYELVEIKKDD